MCQNFDGMGDRSLLTEGDRFCWEIKTLDKMAGAGYAPLPEIHHFFNQSLSCVRNIADNSVYK
jgi:hypothetical protein